MRAEDCAKLPPGNELDRMIANAFGCTLIHHNGLMWTTDPAEDDSAIPWKPSKNIAHAFEVAEMVRREGANIVLLTCDQHGGQWACDIWFDGSRSISMHSDTAAHAICLAALDATWLRKANI